MKKTVLSFALMLLCLCGVLTMHAQDRVNFSFDFEDNAIPSFFTNNAATNTGATSKFWSVVAVTGSGNSSSYCMRSGNAATANSTTSISATITFSSAGTISFDALCEGEGTGDHYYDKCIFSIDGTEQFRYGAQVNGWQHYSYNVALGTHTFTWSYQKDASVDPTGDGFSVDNVQFTNAVQPTVYLNLRKAAITINSSNQLAIGCYKWDNSTSAWYPTKTVESIDFNSFYEIGMWADNADPVSTVIEPVTTINGGSVNIVNRSEGDLLVMKNWSDAAGALTVRKNFKSGNKNLTINHHDGELKLRLNNTWFNYSDDFTFAPTASTTGNNANTKLHIYLKGDNRMYRMCMNNASNAFDDCQVIIESDIGGTGTLVAGKRDYDWDVSSPTDGTNDCTHNRDCGVIGSNKYQNSMDIRILSGVIYAGSRSADFCNAIGAGRQGNGNVTITGSNTIITAVSYSVGATIGGGGTGGDNTNQNSAYTIGCGGTVSITDGATVYAYNHGYSTSHLGTTAIGGGKSNMHCNDQTVTINGSTVYAVSYYGPAIGGGSAAGSQAINATYDRRPGNLTCTITNSTVTAYGSQRATDGTNYTVTLDSYYPCAAFPGIGGGNNANTNSSNTNNGGNLNLTITNSTVTANSIGSGKATNTSCYAGTTNVTVTGNSTLNGTQVVILPTSSSQGTNSFTMTGGSISDRNNTYAYTHYNGGALYIDNDYTTASLSNVTITSSTGRGKNTNPKTCYTGSGGAIYCSSSTSASTSLTLSGCTFDECSTSRYMETGLSGYSYTYGSGGAIYQNYGTLNIQNCNFTDCDTYNCSSDITNGSGMYLSYVTVGNSNTLSNCDFTNCTGGYALFTSYTTATLNNTCSVTGCQGALYAGSGSHITLNSCPISNCTGASQGGAIYATGTSSYWTSVTLNSVDITNCTSTGNGGAIYFTGTWSDLYMNGGRIENCHSTNTSSYTNSGGALYLTCSNANYPSTYNFTNALIKDCYSYGQGGAIYITGTGILTMNGGSIEDCYTTTTSSSYGKGGAIFVDGTTAQKDFSMTLNNLTISGCHTNSKGGAIYKEGSNGDISLNNVSITDCHVTTSDQTAGNYHGGGGIYLYQGGAINLNNGTIISECTAPSGGGVYVYRNNTNTASTRGTINMTAGATIEDCEATGSATSAGYGLGGGVYYDYYSYNSATLSGTITGCSAVNGGGIAIYSNYTSAYPGQIILDGSIYDCLASGLGGGVYIHSKGKLYLTGGDITSNTATTNGGGIYKLGTLMVSGSPIVKGNSVSGTANNVYIPTTAAEDFIYVDNVINPDGIDCGASIGVSKLSSEHTYIDGDYTNITNSGFVSGIGTNNLVPFNAAKANCFQKCEFIIPASALTDLVGKTISTITFHTSEASASFGTAIRFTGFMKTTTASTLSGFEFATGSNVVMSATALSVSNNTLTLTLSSPFTYSDGTKNLHFGLWITTKGSAYSDGVNFEGFPLGGACVSASETTATNTGLANIVAVQRNFVPKMTITTSDASTWVLTQDKLDNTGEITSNCVPICAEKANYLNKCEFIIPSSILQDMGGEKISSITFYTEEASASFGNAVFKLFLESTSSNSITAYGFTDGTSTAYYTGSLSVSGNQMTINLSSNYTYSNSSLNLHIGLWETTKGTQISSGIHFKGYAVSGASVASESTTTTLGSVPCFQRNFLPKMTITTVSGKVWEYPNNPNIMVQNSSSTLRNRAFFDDTQTCGVYNSPVAPSYFDASSNILYLVKHTATNNDFYLDAAAAVAGTDYTLSNDYVSSVLTAKGLAFLSIDVEGGKDYAGRTVTLENDLDLSSYQWEPIGYSTECGGSSSAFAGIFDGQGHHITGLTCQYDYPSLGLFGCLSGTVQNLYVMSGTIGNASNNTAMGGIVGNLVGGSVINCESAVTMTGGPDAIMGGIVGRTPTLPEWVTVGDETANSAYVPTHGANAEQYQKCEYIIPASDLADLNGKDLAGMRFFLKTPASGSWGAARYQIFLKEVSGTTLNAFQGTTGATVVYNGPLDASQSTMHISFNTTYHYSGGNLLVGIYEVEPGTFKDAVFYGTSAVGACVQGDHATALSSVTATQRDFIPKTTFVTESDINEELSNWSGQTAQTVHDGSATNRYLPVYGYFAEQYQKCEYIIPASDLADKEGYITGLTYYLSSPAADSWGTASFRVFLKEVSGTTLSNFQGLNGATIVYEGPLDGTQSTMTITFATPYIYQGGNLLVGIYETVPGTYKDSYFYGETVTGAGIYNYSSTSLDAITTGIVQNFIPKTTLNWLEISNSQILSCTALPTMTGRTMGGVVGRLSSGTVSNSFANPHFTYTGSTEYVGGIAGISQGNVVNCYTRQRSNLSSNYGWIVGDNTGTVSECYIPQGNSNFVANGNTASNSGTYAPAETPYLYMHNDMRLTLNGSLSNEHLIDRLNTWATDHESTAWIRTSASPINGDHPILRYESSDCVASTDNIVLNYSDDFDGLLNTQTSGTILLYGNAGSPGSPITHGNNSNVEVYIDEDATLYHTSTITNAHVGITLKNADWHMFSPSISNAPLGVNYVKTDGTTPDDTNYPFTTGHPAGMPYYQFFLESTQDGYFPSRTYGTTYANNNSGPTTGGNYYEDWDYYTYFEPQYHWINFKRNGNSHHHEDSYNEDIVYQYYNGTNYTVGNEPYLIRGKGYLLGIKQETLLQAKGTLNQGTFTIPLTHDGAYRTGYNFIGNPYQSYFDFNTFAEDNTFIWGGTANACYIMLYDGAYHVYEYNSSANQYAAPRLLHPHQGFMVITRSAGNAQFNNGQRIVSDDANAPFRNLEQPNYTLVNLIVTDDEEKQDIVTVELDRPDEGGAYKQYDMHYGKGCIYAHYEDRDYAVAFTKPGVGVVPIRFETSEDATYTLTWDIENGSIPYVHLIDNMTGIDIDCLTDTVYRFTSTTNDYKSRFKLVFQYTGIDEPDDDDDESGAQTFAFFMGNELVVNGEGFLQIFDVNGRLLDSNNLIGLQSTVRLPNMAAGVYMLRLTNREGTRTQKIIIQH